jgi:hypothetical protein
MASSSSSWAAENSKLTSGGKDLKESKLAREFAAAGVQDCLKKNNNDQSGGLNGGGLLALPFLLFSKANGDCK